MATLPETPETAEELRRRLAALKDKTGHSWDRLSKESGIPAGTLTTWASGQYGGNELSVAARVRRFIDGQAGVQRLANAAAADPGWQQTVSGQRMMSQLIYAHTGEMVAIAASPGTGKTVTAEEYRSQAANVHIITMSPSKRSVREMCMAVLAGLGDPELRYGATAQALSRRIIARLTGTKALLIIDEAQNLSEEALEELRSWHDACRVGIALVGDRRVVARLGGNRRQELAQLHSRISGRHIQDKPLVDDVETVVRAWGVESADSLKFLRGLAGRPGGLRSIVKAIKFASIVAGGDERPVELPDLRAAWAHLNIDDHVIGG